MRYLLLLTFLLPLAVRAQQVRLFTLPAHGHPADTVDVPVRVTGFRQLITAQGTVTFDSLVADCAGVRPGALAGLSSANFGDLHRAHLTFAWLDQGLTGQSLPDSAVLFTVRFRLRGAAGSSTPVGFGPQPTPLEFTAAGFTPVPHSSSGSLLTVGPLAVGPDFAAAPGGFWPNPATGTARFTGPAPATLVLVEAATGRRYERRLTAAGLLDLAGLPAGVYLVRGHRLVVQP